MRTIVFFFSMVLAFGLSAQKEARFTATLEKDSIGAEEYVRVIFTIENVSANGFDAPAFSDFEEVYGPNVSTEMSFINGKMTQKASYTYTLRPKDKGTFVIEPAMLKIKDETLQTEYLKVTVIDTPTTPKRSAPKDKKVDPTKKKKKKKIYRM